MFDYEVFTTEIGMLCSVYNNNNKNARRICFYINSDRWIWNTVGRCIVTENLMIMNERQRKQMEPTNGKRTVN